MAIFKKTSVSIVKTNAWIKPTKISSPINGKGAITGTKNAITKSKISPAKILPNSLNEKDSIRENSPNNSKSPTAKKIGFLKLKNFWM